MVVLHIAWRELRATLSTGTAWAVTCLFLLITGGFWYLMVFNYVDQSQQLMFDPYGGPTLTLHEWLIGPWFSNQLVVLLLVGPAVSMRMFTEEYRQKTFELLLTSPIHTWEIVLGKYLGAMSFGALMLAFTLHVPLTLYSYADPDWGYFLGGYLMLMLVFSVVISVGLLASSYTESQMVALVAGVAAGLGLYMVGVLATDPDGVISQITMGTHTNDLLRGSLRLSDLAYFAMLTLFLLFATQQRLESFRWS